MKFDAKGSIFYHEDDFCQLEILPRENMTDLLAQADNIADFTAEHGNTDIYIRDESKLRLRDRKIRKAELETVLSKLTEKKHTEVATGYGSAYRIKSANTIGYGHDYSAIYFDHEDDRVKNIWLTNLFGLNYQNTVEVLWELGKKWNLILMDWNSSQLIDLSSKEKIRNYLE